MTLGELKRVTLSMFRPPSDMTVSEWADKHRRLAGMGSSERGKWHTDRAPYQREMMDAFSQRGVHDITFMTGAQIGKTVMMSNMIGYTIDQKPGPCLLVMPAEDDAENYSKERLAPDIEATPVLKEKVFGGNANTILMKKFPGGFISLTGAMSPGGLKSRPIKILFMDEVDGYPASAGVEGDPVKLAMKRTQTFGSGAKRVCTSTPTIKATSRIYKEFLHGTQEEWEITCKHCGEHSSIQFDDIRFEKTERIVNENQKEYEVGNVRWRCPKCGGEMEEWEAKRAPAKWVAYNPEALQKAGHRSFHLTSFSSPWATWKEICQKFLDGKDDPEMLKTFYNLELGLPYEHKERTILPEGMYLRREHYEAEVPKGVLVITIGIDTQDNRLEYEVKGWGRKDESWGIQYGVIPGRADEESTWEQVDALLDRGWRLENGKTMKAAVTFMDAGGHFYDSVVEHCAMRRMKRIYPIRGENKETGTLVRHTKSTKKGLNLFLLNVMSGKRDILYNAGITEPGPRYMHYPDNEDAGYDEHYFKGLISEMEKPVKKRGVYVMEWVKIYERNEPLDCCNYARCAFKGFKIDLDAYERRLYGEATIQRAAPIGKPKKPKGLISSGIKI
ncbi:MAG: phage terminase large subunit family protein [Clostridia bacterium]|nr:phage terminase large subunit family protein [Clostridia bacterium]